MQAHIRLMALFALIFELAWDQISPLEIASWNLLPFTACFTNPLSHFFGFSCLASSHYRNPCHIASLGD